MTDSSPIKHRITEKEREEIRKEAKKIMNSFSEKLSGLKNLKEPSVQGDKAEREEKEGKNPDDSFRKKMFENAPDKKRDFMITGKKDW